MIDRLVATPLRQLWPHEATDFTPWLADNIDLLGDALNMTLEDVETEAAVGGFSADLVTVNDQGETVLVENAWPTLWEWLVPTMGRLANAIDPVLDRY